MKYADLHIHTHYSDSTFSPKQVVDYAHEKGIEVIAITDHDTVEGIKETKKYADKVGIEVIPGVEMTTISEDGVEIHMLGYFIDIDHKKFNQEIERIGKSRYERVYEICKKFNEHDIPVKPEDVFALSHKGILTRLHIARAVVNTGKVIGIGNVFKKYLRIGGPCYVAHDHFTPKQAIEKILEVKGVPVVAHPKTIVNDVSMIKELVDYGLKGIEIFHTLHNSSDEKKYKKLAKKYDLIITGGSDCHGTAKPEILMGRRLVEYSVVEQLRKLHESF